MPKIYSKFDKPLPGHVPSGTGTLREYQEEIKKGVKGLVFTGLKNVYEMIQMDYEQTKIENILHSALMGDFSSLKARDGSYVDATTMPKNLMDAQNLVIRMKSEFDKMPIEVKEKFNNSADMYVEMMGTKDFNDIMAPYNEKIAKIAAEKSHKEYIAKVKEGAKLNYDIAKEQAILEGGQS